MVKISKYFSLLKFSITHPKEGVDMLNAAIQTQEDSKQKIKEHTAKSLQLEKTLDELFPNNGFSKKKMVEDTKELQINFKDYFEILSTFGVDFGWRRGYGLRFKTKVFVFF